MTAYCVPGDPTVLKTTKKIFLNDGLHSRPKPTITTDADMPRHYVTHKNSGPIMWLCTAKL